MSYDVIVDHLKTSQNMFCHEDLKGLLPLALLEVLIKQLRIGRGDHREIRAIRLADGAVGTVEGHDLRIPHRATQ